MNDFDIDQHEYSGMTRGDDVEFVMSVLALFILVVISDLWARYHAPILAAFVVVGAWLVSPLVAGFSH